MKTFDQIAIIGSSLTITDDKIAIIGSSLTITDDKIAIIGSSLTITDFSWKFQPTFDYPSGFMTSSLDSIQRFWSESQLGSGLVRFDMSNIIESANNNPCKSATNIIESENNNPCKSASRESENNNPCKTASRESENNNPCKTASRESENNNPCKTASRIHWLTGDAFSESILKNDIANNNCNLIDILNEFPDMVFQINSEGVLRIWGIQGFASTSRRVSKVNLLMKCVPKNGAFINESPFFQEEIQSFVYKVKNHCNLLMMIDIGSVISVLGSDCNKVGHRFEMKLGDFFTKAWISPTFSLVGEWDGPTLPIAYIEKHPLKKLVYIQSEATNSIYKYSLNVNNNLTLICTLLHNTNFAWFPSSFKY
jgi:hypothetical protein